MLSTAKGQEVPVCLLLSLMLERRGAVLGRLLWLYHHGWESRTSMWAGVLLALGEAWHNSGRGAGEKQTLSIALIL